MSNARANSILEALYEPDYVFLRDISNFDPDECNITGCFLVPSTERLRYTKTPLEYVPSIERHMCINQLGYVLVGLLVSGQTREFAKISPALFAETELAFRMWSTKEHFNHKCIISKDKEFQVQMRVIRAKVSVSRLSIVEVEFTGAICGEVQFAARYSVV